MAPAPISPRVARGVSALTAASILAGCTGGDPAPPAAPDWAATGAPVVFEASGTPAPAFPPTMPGYRLTTSVPTTVRVFETSSPQTIYGLPATMNGCDLQRFLVRWRALEPSAVVEVTTTSYDGSVTEAGSRQGSAGWWSGHGCAQPAWRLVDLPGESTLVDLTVEYEVWEAAP